MSERPAEDLFTLDVAGEESIKADYGKKHKPLKSEQIIAQRSAVPAVDSRKRKSADGIASGSSKRNKNGSYVSYADLQRLKALANASSATPNHLDAPAQAAYDPWAVQPTPPAPEVPSFLEEKKLPRQPQTMHRPPVSLASNGKPFAAVKKPTGGKSYNPAFEEWDALITREGQKEVEAEAKRVQEAKEDEERMAKALAEAAKPEPKEGDDDYESAWESEWEGIQSEAEDSYLHKKRPERKTPTERSKIKKRKEAEARAKWEKQQKKKEDQQNRIRELTKQVEKKERQRKAQAAAAQMDPNESADEDEVLRRRKFGKNPYAFFSPPFPTSFDRALTIHSVSLKPLSRLSWPTSCKIRFVPCDPKAIFSRIASAILCSMARSRQGLPSGSQRRLDAKSRRSGATRTGSCVDSRRRPLHFNQTIVPTRKRF